MIRQQISLFLTNKPGELGRLASLLGDNDINIEALSIQDASSYVVELFRGRGRYFKRYASGQNYTSMKVDSKDFALIRMLVNDTDKAIELLSGQDFVFDIVPVVAILLDNNPGELAKISAKFGEEGINIDYVYGSAANSGNQVLFVFRPQEMELASKIFGD